MSVLPTFTTLGKGHTVLMLHGIGGGRSIWSDASSGTALAVAGLGCRAVAVDLPGYGDSIGAGEPTLAHMVSTVVDLLDHLAPRRVALLGHSMGGILYGLMPPHPAIDRVVTLGSGSGYTQHLAKPLRYSMGFFWNVMVPVSVRMNGYFAGRRLRAVGDLPRGVVGQWRRWCKHPDFIVSEGDHVREAYARVKTPITVVMVADDGLASREGVRAVHSHYTQADLRWVTLKPRELGVKAIGHFHFFHPKAGPRVWSVSLPWLGA